MQPLVLSSASDKAIGTKVIVGTLIAFLFIGAQGSHGDTLDDLLNEAADRHGLERTLVRAIASVESNRGQYKFNESTIDYGVMQINYRTANHLGLNTTRLYQDDAYNIEVATSLLQALKRHFKHDWVCRYNVGYGKLVSKKAIRCQKYLDKLQKAGYVASSVKKDLSLVAGDR